MIQQARISKRELERELAAERDREVADWLEARALQSLHQRCPPPTATALGLSWTERGPARVSIARNEPSILLNRALGLDLLEPVRLETLDGVDAVYRQASVAQYLVQLYRLAGVPSERQLAAAGWVKARGWRKFHRGLGATPEVNCTLAVRRLQNRERDAPQLASFARIAAAAFDLSPALEPLIRALATDPRWHLFVSLDGERVAGTGALFVERHPETRRRLGWLDFGTTAPEYRRRGSQAAVLAARIGHARQLGCDELVTTTGEAVPGDPQHSYRNILRSGFSEGPLRENWRRAT